MAHKSSAFKKTCRIITSLLGVGDSIFLIFSYADKYWLSFFGYRQFALSIALLLFSIGTFASAILVFLISKKYKAILGYFFSLLCVIDFFLIFSLLYLSSFKAKDEAYYWINVYNNTHQNQQIMIDFSIDYPPNKIDSYIRFHTVYIHDVIFLTMLIWIFLFILFTFFSHELMICLFGKKVHTHKEVNLNQNGYGIIENIETEYEYEYDTTITSESKNNKPHDFNKRSKIEHVRSADRILHLVNINDKDGKQTPPLPKKKADTPDDTPNKSTSSLATIPSSLQTKESDKSQNPAHKKKKRKNNHKTTQVDNIQAKGRFHDDTSDAVIVSISPSPSSSPSSKKKKYHTPKEKWNPNHTPKIDLSDDDAKPHKKYPRVKYKWKVPIHVTLSSSSSSDSLSPPPLHNFDDEYSSELLYYESDGSFNLFGFDYSDSW